jgi:hypothetical protein
MVKKLASFLWPPAASSAGGVARFARSASLAELRARRVGAAGGMANSASSGWRRCSLCEEPLSILDQPLTKIALPAELTVRQTD